MSSTQEQVAVKQVASNQAVSNYSETSACQATREVKVARRASWLKGAKSGSAKLGIATFAAALFLSALPPNSLSQAKAETIGGGTVSAPAVGPAPSYGLGGSNMVLVKNWNFGSNGTIRNYADMNDNFFYHDQFGTIGNGTNYGAVTVSPDAANALYGQPIEGVNSPPVRQFNTDSLKTFLTPLNGATTVTAWDHNAGNGSFMAKWKLPNGGSLLGRDIVWETRVRYVTPPYFWFALWTAGNKWKWDGSAQGAEQDLMESFGYDNNCGPGCTNYDGRYWHSNAVANPSKDDYNFWDWGGTMSARGINNWDPTQYHTWTWVYKKDNSYAMYMDGIRVQGGTNYWWTFGNTATDEPVDMDFLFDAGWGHTQIGSVNKSMAASQFAGKFFEWDYSRVYLSGDNAAPINRRIAIRANNSGRFVSSDQYWSTYLRSAWATSVGGWETFVVRDAGNGQIALWCDVTGKYVTADMNDGGNLQSRNVSAIYDWEKFVWVDLGNGNFGLKAVANNKFVSANLSDNHRLMASWATSPGTWESFSYSDLGAG